jgi:hypothetical protein
MVSRPISGRHPRHSEVRRVHKKPRTVTLTRQAADEFYVGHRACTGNNIEVRNLVPHSLLGISEALNLLCLRRWAVPFCNPTIQESVLERERREMAFPAMRREGADEPTITPALSRLSRS